MSEMRGFAVELARAGGRIAREHFRHVAEKDVRAKGSRDYVSHVDHLVEDAIVRRIRSRFAEHRILGEEGGLIGDEVEGDQSHRPLWIIDPIDGTTNFIHGVPWFAVSIAYTIGGETVDAVVYDPVRDEAFIGERGAGLWVNSERASTSGCRDLSRALLATGLPFKHPECLDDAVHVLHEVQRRCDDHRRTGSAALDMAYVAAGRLDGYYEIGVHPWDVAAGDLLVRCAGGVATDLRGGQPPLTERRSVLCAASGDLHAALADLCAPLAAWTTRPPFAIPGAC
jgi:myo-inositol-1(or 4)-monophosphatase